MSDGYRIVTEPSEINIKTWSDFVYHHPDGNIFQTYEMYQVYGCSGLNKPVTVFCLKEEQIAGLACAVILKEYKGPAGGLTSRSILTGGPLIKNNDQFVAGIILEQYNELVKGEVIYSEIRNWSDVSHFHAIFNRCGFEFEPHLNVIINLKKGTGSLWKGLHPTRRKQIERSTRRGVRVKVAETPDPNMVRECYALLAGVYRNAGVPLAGQEYFIQAVMNLQEKNMIRIFLAELDGKIIGFRFVLCYKKVIYDWYAGSNRNFLDKYPNDILPWNVMIWGVENDFDFFDFGGAGRPDEPYGVRDFKMKFGGDSVNYGRFKKVHKKMLYGILSNMYKIGKKIRTGR